MQPEDESRWDSFVNTCTNATFFHKAGWKTVIERSFGHKTFFLYAQSNGEIVGVLPLAQVKSVLFGHSLSGLPFCVYGGVASHSDAAKIALTKKAQELTAELNVGYLELRNREPQNTDWISKDLYVTFRKSIDPDEETNMLAIPRKQRAMVRKGIKENLVSEIDQNIDRFYFAYASSVHNLGTPVFSKKYFRILKEVFKDDCEILTIVKEKEVISSVLSFYFKDEVLPYYGGGTSRARAVAGNDFMYWELMRRACARGYKIFDFGRSKRGTGAFDFKKNWGFEAEPLHYEYLLHANSSLPENNPLNPRYQRFIQLWRRMPLPLANFIGPFIVKNLG
ncbi:FemAB family XrtA/PEP-CTERM system-associated protein [Undibacterium sp. SXout20W]|uniref:FemAB family XrtA/PEP-CTERM system-associated protein n=1 Tax=Undibacterium sp. SXout20W TaxID=3413051 RepID=UPI003BF29CE5